MDFKNLNTTKIKEYAKYFKPEKLWEKLKKYGKSMGRETVYYVVVLYYVMASPKTSLKDKAIIAGALGYLILPLDLIPDYIPLIGYTDDMAAIMAVIKQLQGSITPEIESRARTKISDWFDSSEDCIKD